MRIVAQLMGLGAMAALFMVYQQKSRTRLLWAKLAADVFWAIHYLCLGGMAGMIPNAVGILRELVFLRRKECKWASHRFWPLVFILISWTWGLATLQSPIGLLPLSASSFVTLSLWIDNPRLTKAISLPVSLAFLVYDLFIGSWVGCLNECIGITSIVLSLIQTNRRQQP